MHPVGTAAATPGHAPYVAVIGPGDGATPTEIEHAHEVGRRLADSGCIVVCGGLGGVMAAAAAGARSGGGISIGLLPGADRDSAAGPLTVAIPTGLGELRNALVIRAADAVIGVGGSWGTLSEVALAMRAELPVVLLDGWRVLDEGGEELRIPQADSASAAVAMVHGFLSLPVNRSTESAVLPIDNK